MVNGSPQPPEFPPLKKDPKDVFYTAVKSSYRGAICGVEEKEKKDEKEEGVGGDNRARSIVRLVN